MEASIFVEKGQKPTQNELKDQLGETFKLWESVGVFVQACKDGVWDEWNFTGKKHGWGFRMKRYQKTIIYLVPCVDFFKIGFVFGAGSTIRALQSDLSDAIKTIIKNAPLYPEGRGFWITVDRNTNMEDIYRLIRIKLSL